MTNWTPDELGALGAADEFDIAALRPDGTMGAPQNSRASSGTEEVAATSWMIKCRKSLLEPLAQ